MSGFNGAMPTPINSNSAQGIRDTLNVPSKTEMEDAIAQSTADVIRTGDVVNNLTSMATDKPLAAAQGKALSEAIAQSTADAATSNGVYLNKNIRGGVGYNDITMPKRNAGGFGIIYGSSGAYMFRINNSNEPVAITSGLTISAQGNDVYRFTFSSEWYTSIIIMTTWKYWN